MEHLKIKMHENAINQSEHKREKGEGKGWALVSSLVALVEEITSIRLANQKLATVKKATW